MKDNILEELNLKEDHERECKLATGGLPESIWETYSSFANINGGTILLGIKEHRDSFTVEGLTEKKILRIDIPATDRHDKPVYIGTDPMKGTYKRDYEGDFLCAEEAARAMFVEQRDVSRDIEVIDEMGILQRFSLIIFGIIGKNVMIGADIFKVAGSRQNYVHGGSALHISQMKQEKRYPLTCLSWQTVGTMLREENIP